MDTRHQKGQRLTAPNRSDIEALAALVLETRKRAQDWLRQPSQGLGCARPRDLLGTPDGRMAVRDELLRIEHGYVA